jgi:hypothetical protein
MSEQDLILILIISLFAFGVLVIAQTINYQREKGKRLRALGSEKVYKRKPYFLNKSEATLLNLLEEKLKVGYRVFPQANLLSFIEVEKDFENRYEEIETLRKFTVDFLVVKTSNFEPKLVIELDGGYHNRFGPKNRDSYVNNVCDNAKIDIKHIKVGDSFKTNIAEINKELD